MVVELGLDLELDAVAGEERVHRCPQHAAEDQRGCAAIPSRRSAVELASSGGGGRRVRECSLRGRGDRLESLGLANRDV